MLTRHQIGLPHLDQNLLIVGSGGLARTAAWQHILRQAILDERYCYLLTASDEYAGFVAAVDGHTVEPSVASVSHPPDFSNAKTRFTCYLANTPRRCTSLLESLYLAARREMDRNPAERRRPLIVLDSIDSVQEHQHGQRLVEILWRESRRWGVTMAGFSASISQCCEPCEHRQDLIPQNSGNLLLLDSGVTPCPAFQLSKNQISAARNLTAGAGLYLSRDWYGNVRETHLTFPQLP